MVKGDGGWVGMWNVEWESVGTSRRGRSVATGGTFEPLGAMNTIELACNEF